VEPRPPVSPSPGASGAPSVLTDYEPPSAPDEDRLGLHVGLFVATFVSSVWCGALLVGRAVRWDPLVEVAGDGIGALLALLTSRAFLQDGFLYAVPFLGFLTVHEFGHYLAARWRRTRVSLPYFIPVPLPSTLGTFGAVIRIKEPLRRTRQLFDIGAAGPLAGFVAAVLVLLIAVLALPGPDYLLSVPGHEDTAMYLRSFGRFPEFVSEPGTTALVFGDTPLFHLVGSLGWTRVPGHEIMHYPVLLAGWLALFFTALNLLPVGQLDGGHVVYALFGPRVHQVVARVTVMVLLLSGGVGLVTDLAPGTGPLVLWAGLALVYAAALAWMFRGEWLLTASAVAFLTAATAFLVVVVPGLAEAVGWTGWLFWVGLILFVIRVDHPPVQIREPLTPGRTALGVLCIVIFFLCFSIQPIQFVG
jgi:membrane-associated protease RseP (regulator of RpoE activity)